jgi:sulfur carrier protein
MTVVVNGEARDLPAGSTVRDLLEAQFVPRGEWETTELDDGARVEVLRAIQGG